MEFNFDPQQLLRLFFFQRVDWNAGPASNDVFNVVARDFRRHQGIFMPDPLVRIVAVRSRPFIQFVPIGEIALFAS